MNSELVSVIIPTYKRPDMLREAIQSVKAQDYPFIEIIVVDDCSDDNTKQVVNDFPDVQYYCNDKNKGPGYSRKFAFLACKGNYVVFLDDDDYYTDSTFFSKAMDHMQENDYAFVGANAHILEENGTISISNLNLRGSLESIEYLSGFPFKNKKPHSTFTTVFSKEHLLKVGLADMEMVNDMAIYMRSLINGKIYLMDDDIGVYRMHNNNISKKIDGDFLIKNLEEKLAIYSIIKNDLRNIDHQLWWLEQIKITVSYYVYGSHPTMSEFKVIKRWCEQNSLSNPYVEKLLKQYSSYLIDYRICKLKSKIKKAFGIN